MKKVKNIKKTTEKKDLIKMVKSLAKSANELSDLIKESEYDGKFAIIMSYAYPDLSKSDSWAKGGTVVGGNAESLDFLINSINESVDEINDDRNKMKEELKGLLGDDSLDGFMKWFEENIK